jgi:tripartite-type tricarboxylate transporter receptor subunit TctC
MTMRPLLSIAAAAALLIAAPCTAQDAASYPAKPVIFVVPFAPGGPTDTLGRLLTQKLGERLGKPFIVENRPGAGGNTGSAQVARAAPNGYTLLLGTVSTHGINPSLYKNMPYDHKKDFAPVSQISLVPNMLVVNPKLPVNSVPELIAYLKQNPGKVFYATPGSGTSIHLASELFKMRTGTDMTHVPYKGSAPAMQDVISGQVQLMFDNTVTAWPHVRAGNVRAIGVTSPTRLAIAPDVPAIAEFLPGFSASAWHGVLVPAGTPPAIVDKLSLEIQQIMKDPDMVAQMAKFEIVPVGNTPAEFAAFIAEENDRWAAVVAKLGLKVE